MFNGNPYLQLRYRVGTSRSRKKMKYFVSDFDFLTIHEADKKIDWDTSQVVNLQNGQ